METIAYKLGPAPEAPPGDGGRRRGLLPRGGTWWSLIAIIVIAVGIAGGWVCAQLVDLPRVEALEEHRPSLVTSIFARDGMLIGEFFIERRILLPQEAIPERVKQALIAVEDGRFYQHIGVDPVGILRAVVANAMSGRVVEGGSTITQQLAKVLFLTPEQSMRRKIKEAGLALAIERRYSKDQILTLYCNQIYFGEGAYGIEAAAKTYFQRSAGELGLAEVALIAGLPKAPSKFSPFHSADKARRRRDHVLRRMFEMDFVSRKELEDALSLPVEAQRLSEEEELAPYFVEEVRRTLADMFGTRRLYSAGMRVYTTLDPELQRAANAAVHAELASRREQAVASGTVSGGRTAPAALEAALLAADPADGSILAMVGGYDYQESQFNRALQARRQAGSAFKPLVYTAAIDNGYTAGDVIVDAPIEFRDATGKVWRPENYENRFYGATTLREALEHSRNIVAIKLMSALGPALVIEYAHRMGIAGEFQPFLSLALGSGEVSLGDLVTAYSVLASGGIRSRLRLLRYITDQRGRMITESTPEREEVLSAETAYVVTQMLTGVVERGTGQVAKKLRGPLAAKTGTTNDYTDAWFVGYSASLVTGVWVGRDQKESLGHGQTGARAAGPIWVRFMEAAQDARPPTPFAVPPGIVFVGIDPRTGKKAGPRCPQVFTEAFKRGSEPKQLCAAH
ncbi:MAG: PBP1A family penicillin-binding protein [Candidatus Schekmanbacteria bacterium]|nr:PBP1A family penicillin-binding protein [Candidatus Schekmanbacteria bacterium]